MKSKWMPQASLLNRQIEVLVIGAGGTGSQVTQGLGPLHTALLALGHPGGLRVSVLDPSVVRETNLARQPFYASDLGQYKATVVATRVMAQYAAQNLLVRAAISDNIQSAVGKFRPDIIFGCVDTRQARATIAKIKTPHSILWMDIGNRNDDGQCIFGTLVRDNEELDIPHIGKLYPEAIDTKLPEDNQPSCSMAESLERQSLYINRLMATMALDMFSRFLREGLEHHGRIINLREGTMNRIAVDPEVWARMGYRPTSKENKKAA